MTAANRITVDWDKEGAPSAVLPVAPWLSSSSALGWRAIQVQLHRQPAWECPEHTFLQHVISLHHFPQPAKSERCFSGRKQTEWLAEGSVVIMPANIPHQDRWNKPGAFTLLILDPARIAQIAQYSMDPARVEIIPRFAMRDGLIRHIATALEAELTSGGGGIDLYVETLAAALSAYLLRNHSSLARLNERPSYKQEEMRRAVEFMSDNFYRNLRLADIAAVAHMSEFHFARTFKQVMGVPPHRFLIERRIEHAQGLLRTTALSVDEVAHRVGFSNQSQFTAHFRKTVGAAPKIYRSGY
jgi:AraC family transcriptional regulator